MLSVINVASFTSLSYFIFLAAVVAVYYLLPVRARNAFLVLASYVFYFMAGRMLHLGDTILLYLAATTLIAFFGGLIAPRVIGTRYKTAVKMLFVLAALSLLVLFKYSGFLLQLFGAQGLTIQLLVPIGISYYTFQNLGYLLDCFRGRAPEQSLVDYALYAGFFPQVLMGPIGNSADLLPQIKTPHKFSYQALLHGAQRFLWGLAKKLVLAGWLDFFVQALYADLAYKRGIVLLVAAMVYMIQLYMDFSGYTDMALGSAQMLGFRLSENFAAPFFATSITDFWKRWHQSLTAWLRTYIYIPLGGSRKGFARKLALILFVFVVSGLWHEAGYNYLLWGALFGLLRVVEELIRKYVPARPMQNGVLRGVWHWIRRLGTFFVVSLLFVFFRIEDFGDALYVLRNCLGGFDLRAVQRIVSDTVYARTGAAQWYVYAVILALGAFFVLVMALEYRALYRPNRPDRPDAGNILRHLPGVSRWICYVVLLLAIVFLGVFGQSSFIYFIY